IVDGPFGGVAGVARALPSGRVSAEKRDAGDFLPSAVMEQFDDAAIAHMHGSLYSIVVFYKTICIEFRVIRDGASMPQPERIDGGGDIRPAHPEVSKGRAARMNRPWSRLRAF